ncbi:MAG: ABC transporter permease [Steroidobacteraceae bacterium]|nr:ABC transporter permease [Steroidobacteraceae bacterium]
MKHFPLVLALFRKPVRKLLSAVALIVAFLLFSLLQGVNAAFQSAIQTQKLDRLFVDSRFVGALPVSYREQIEKVPGVTHVAQIVFVPGHVQDPSDYVLAVATDALNYLAIRPEYEIAPEQVEALIRTRDGAIVGQAGQSVSRLLKFVAYGIGGCMLLGALAVALNAMYSSVSTRVIEIATLRALGFSSPSIVTALFLEALVLSLIGALIGAGIAWTFYQHKEISTLTGASAAQLTYSLQITASLVASAIVIACVVGFTGGLFPALRATRLGIAVAIRKVA